LDIAKRAISLNDSYLELKNKSIRYKRNTR